MGTSGSPPGVTRQDVRGVFSQLDDPSTPLTTDEVAEVLDCPGRVARRNLDELADRDAVRSKRVNGSDRVWWRPASHESTDEGSESTGEGPASAGEGPGATEFEAFVSAVRDYAIFTLDPDGTVANWNEGAERIKGYREGEIVGEHFSTFYTPSDVDDGVPEANLEAAATDGRAEDEGWRVREDGSRFWANVVITAVRDADGELKGFTKVTRDMTEQREYEQELRQERDLVEQLFETAPVSICLVSEDGEVLRANQRMIDRIDAASSDLSEYGVESWDLFDAEGDPIPTDEWPWTRVLETGEPVSGFECRVDLPAVGERWLSLNAAPMEGDRPDADAVVVAVDDVTDQKERERRLRREHEQTEQLLRTAPIPIAVQDATGETVMANQRAQDLVGLSEAEILEDPDDLDQWEVRDANGDEIPPDEMPSVRALESGEPVFDEAVTVDPPNGDRLQLNVNAAPICGSDGAVERVVTAAEDVTELRRRERQLERRKDELETELSEVLGRISDAFYALDDEWQFTHLNERAADIMGRSTDELLGRSVWDVFSEAGAVYRERFEAAMETQDPVTFEVYEDQIEAWLEFNVYPSESGLSIYFRDVTDRKEREQELAKYETIVETANDGIYVKDGDGRFTMVNEAYAELTGYDRETLVGEHASLVVDEATLERAKERKAGVDGGTDRTMQADIVTADGDRVPTEGTFGAIETEDGDVQQVGVVRDVSERKEYERRIEESNERLEQFAYAASHDLQEPLRMVSSYLQLLENRYQDDLDEDGREFLEFAVDGAERMRAMIDGLLEYSRIETRGAPSEPVDLESVVADVREDLQLQIAESDAEVTVDSLPRVEGDSDQLRQVFQNLLDNAIEYSGDEPPRIDVAAERSGDEWTLSVTDEGIGIDPDDADNVFEVFHRLHTQEEHAGTGIGLALCRRIVERHGGEIWIESGDGGGTTVSFTLPAASEGDE